MAGTGAKRQAQLDQQKRRSYAQDQQRYWERIRQDQARLQQAQYYDNLTYNYRYRRGNKYYYTSQYGAQMLQNALNNGYQEGFRAGQADRADNWRYNYQSSYGYQDASYGYDNYYVDYSEYNYYFRQGFAADMRMAITAEAVTAITRTAITRSWERSSERS